MKRREICTELASAGGETESLDLACSLIGSHNGLSNSQSVVSVEAFAALLECPNQQAKRLVVEVARRANFVKVFGKLGCHLA